MTEEKLLKYIADEVPFDQEISDWLRASASNEKRFSELKIAYALSQGQQQRMDEAVLQQQFDRLMEKRPQQPQIQPFWSVGRVAAVLVPVFCLLGMLAWQLMGNIQQQAVLYSEIFAEPGQIVSVKLPDGSTVRLNSGSSLKYANDFFHNNERRVHLSGEAYFDVAKDKKHQFVVDTKSADMVVYGTTFNVDAYESDREVVTTLITGSLGVKDKSGHQLAVLKPAEQLKFSPDDRKYSLRKVSEAQRFAQWKEGVVSFRKESLSNIGELVERWYPDVKFVIQDDALNDKQITGTIVKSKPIDQFVKAISLSTDLKYEIKNKKGVTLIIFE